MSGSYQGHLASFAGRASQRHSVLVPSFCRAGLPRSACPTSLAALVPARRPPLAPALAARSNAGPLLGLLPRLKLLHPWPGLSLRPLTPAFNLLSPLQATGCPRRSWSGCWTSWTRGTQVGRQGCASHNVTHTAGLQPARLEVRPAGSGAGLAGTGVVAYRGQLP